ncbi:MAG: ABC transporter ATP-binding protein [Alphaproteobacteria bacterium]|nr:ABC transporter ATP-binding protein [Alphaproteobacteria bacterium]
MANPLILQLKNVTKTYASHTGPVTVLKNANLDINTGETVAVVGQSGSGKSTLLHIAGLLDVPNSGTVSVKGHVTAKLKDADKARIRNNSFGFIYQHHHLMREFNALENVLMPARIAGKLNEETKAYAIELLDKVKLSHRLEHFPNQLSGGERQRVAIARALMNKPASLLADEPTGNLDPATADEVSTLFNTLVEEYSMALLLVTHNTGLAATCQRSYQMAEGQLVKI